jgi:hypothetical protein
MSTLEGKKMISQEYGLIDKLVQVAYKPQGKKALEFADGVPINKDGLIILLHSLFDYDETFMRDRVNQDLMLQLLTFLQKFLKNECGVDQTKPCLIST